MYTIEVTYDAECDVWIGENEELGLVAEAGDFATLKKEVELLMPDLLELNTNSLAARMGAKASLCFQHRTTIGQGMIA